MPRWNLVIVLSIVTGIFTGSAIAQANRRAEDNGEIGKTLFFEDDDSFPEGSQVPPIVIEALLRDKMASYARDMREKNPHEDLNQYFRSVRIGLHPGGMDFLVRGLAPLTGADCAWFWIVSTGGTSAHVVLFDNTSSIQFLKTRTNKFLDVQSVWCSPNECDIKMFKFDGHRYRMTQQSWKAND